MRIFSCIFAVVLLLQGVAGADEGYAVGYRAFDAVDENIAGGVWYPSDDEEVERRLGPFETLWAWDGAPAAGRFPVILFSHGVLGRYRNHRDMAEALARAGYVVVIPQHSKDLWVGSSATFAAIEHRIGEFSRTLAAFMRAQPTIAAVIDADKVGAIGYSLGGLTALGAAGAVPSVEAVRAHCRQNSDADEGFCDFNPDDGDRAWYRKAVAWAASLFSDSGLEEKDSIAHLEPPLDFRAIALIAPVGVIFPASEVQGVDAALAIFRLGDDDIVSYPYHAEYLHRALADKPHVYKVYEGVHHFAFISPFPAWLLEEEHIPVALDPIGFDRVKFLREINADIVAFFEREMGVGE